MLLLGPLLDAGGTELPSAMELEGRLLLEIPPDPTGGSEDGACDENGGNVPVPIGNELLFGTVTIRLDDHEGRIELECPTGTDAGMLLLGIWPILLEDTGASSEFDEWPPYVRLDGPGEGGELPDTGATLLPGMTSMLETGCSIE